jgi:tRNA nucleotidyltransferase (CCA-adding enzyme)
MNKEIKIIYPDREYEDAVSLICEKVKHNGGRAFLVGGCVRDAFLGLQVKDIDIEVYGIEPDKLENILSTDFRLDHIGKAFGVLMVHGLGIDISIPRRESKSGMGHKGFEILSDPHMSTEEAASRRDFTVNAILLDPLNGEIVDHYNGVDDLGKGVLRHTSDKFTEDPLRVLRTMQFAARFEFDVAPDTVDLCKTITIEDLPEERIFREWEKLILKGSRPSIGLKFLRECGWIKYFPELEAMIDCKQEPRWHPEGDVWDHTLHCMDAFADDKINNQWEDLVVGLAVLCHDLGKPLTTAFSDGRIRSIGHTKAGEEPTRSFLGRMTRQIDLVRQVVPLVVNHLTIDEIYKKAGDAAIRRLAARVHRIDRLVRVFKADRLGRPPKGLGSNGQDIIDWILGKANDMEIANRAPGKIIMGRHLIELGLEPGPEFGRIIEKCYDAQLDGDFTDIAGGKDFLKSIVND